MGGSNDLNVLIVKALALFVVATEHIGIRLAGLALFHAGDDIRAREPVRLFQVMARPSRRMVRMRMVETYNVEILLARLLLRGDQLFWWDVVTVRRRVFVAVLTADDPFDHARAVLQLPDEDSATFLRIF